MVKKKSLLLKNIGLQFFYSFNFLLKMKKSNFDLEIKYKYLTNNFKSNLTGKFLVSADFILQGFFLNYKKTLKKLNLKYVLIEYLLNFNFFKVLNKLRLKTLLSRRLQFFLSNKTILRDFRFIDTDDFNYIDNIRITHNDNLVISGVILELTDLLKTENIDHDLFNLGSWLNSLKVDLKIKNLNDLLYLVLFNL